MRHKSYPPSVCPGIPQLGPCPEGWTTRTYGDVLQVIERPAKIEDGQEYQLVNAKRSRGGIVSRSHMTGREIKTKTQFYVREGDFLIANRQIVHGACGIVPPELDGALVSNEYTVLHPRDGLWMPFFAYFTRTTHFQQTCFHSSIGVDIEKMVFKLDWWLNHKFHFPPLPEQKKLTEILLAWDHSSEQTGKLIELKIRWKRSLVQQLLTGKHRLPGFNEPWKESVLSDVAEVRFSNVDKRTEENELAIRLCNYLDVYNNESISSKLKFMRGTASKREIEIFGLKKGDVLVTKDSETPEDIAKCCFVEEDMANVVCGYHLAVVRPKPAVIDGLFLAKHLSVEAVRRQFISRANGVTRFGLNTETFQQVRIAYPGLEEQRRLGAIFSALDDEIRLLREKRFSLEKQKQGLMKKLLTGELRVKV